MFHNNLNGNDEEIARQRAHHFHEEVSKTSIKGTIITGLIIAVVLFVIFYGIAYFSTH
ncbi:hypothetical protein [Saccharibacillus sp. JS10]|uniref:hypothetical protein n=1 Tax=Saccharibacillus sp. JS10 TaxID=2950552 RepID=UPI00210A83DD|nr:hypothetical protein [Saccharibacillus sp. JS10]MCQ4086671.1 hypothetical protein [Saccharibacillus sp. JS10]